MFIVAPPKNWLPKGWSQASAKVRTSAYDMTHWQMLRQPSFYVIYVMMTLVAFGGLVVTAQIEPIAGFYNVDKVIIVWGMSALVVAIELNRIVNGLCRPFWGWVSDHIGRENTMFIAFLSKASPSGPAQADHQPVLFILLSSVCFFAWGEIFSLFPSIIGRPVRQEMGDHQLRHRLHGQRSGIHLRRTGGRHGQCQDRLVDRGFLGHDRLRHGRRLPGAGSG